MVCQLRVIWVEVEKRYGRETGGVGLDFWFFFLVLTRRGGCTVALHIRGHGRGGVYRLQLCVEKCEGI